MLKAQVAERKKGYNATQKGGGGGLQDLCIDINKCQLRANCKVAIGNNKEEGGGVADQAIKINCLPNL